MGSPPGQDTVRAAFRAPRSSSRFSDAGEDFPTAFAEAVVRDRFEGKRAASFYRPQLDALCVTAISSSRQLTLVDLTGAGAFELGIDTDANRARNHGQGQQFAELLHGQLTAIDGILFASRLTDARCIAIFERALPSLSGSVPVPLLQAAELVPELRRLKITVRRERNFDLS